jgi:hypothetical protein
MADVIETEGGDDVTFVGGRAVEQQTSGQEPEGDHGDERAAAMAAVKKAIAEDAREEGKRAAKEAKTHMEKDPLVPKTRGADGKFASDDPAAKEREEAVRKLEAENEPPEPKSETKAQLQKALAERRETARLKAEAAAELQRDREETRRFYQQLQVEKQEIAQEKARLAKLRTDPIRAIRENGWDPEQFIMDVAMDGTPEGQKARADRELLERLDRQEAWQKRYEEQEQKRAAEQQRQAKAQFRQSVETEFLTEAFKDKHLAGLYKGNEAGLLAMADTVADKYREITTVRDSYGRVIKPGQEATAKEIAEFLAERSARWYKSLSNPQDEGSVTRVDPPKVRATGKSLGPNSGGERRTLGTNLVDLDEEDRIAAAKEAAKTAIRLSGDS